MIKKSMLAACLAALALVALPAIAAAEETSNPGDPYLDGVTTGTTFTLEGGEGELNTVGGKFVRCSSVHGHGEFHDAETGTVEFTFTGCKTTLGIKCTTPGEETAGTIQVGPLPFHLKTVKHEGQEKPGILVTPNNPDEKGKGYFTEFKCSFAGSVRVEGNGIVGTITDPEEGVASKTATIAFQEVLDEAEEPTGVQTHKTVTDHNAETEEGFEPTEYHLESSFNGGEYEESAEQAGGTISYAEGMEPKLTTTPTE